MAEKEERAAEQQRVKAKTQQPKARKRVSKEDRLKTLKSDLLKVGAEFWSAGDAVTADKCKASSDLL